MKTGKATSVVVRLERDHALNFAPAPGDYFLVWTMDDDGCLTIRSGNHRQIFACGAWDSIGVDDYHLKKDLH